MYSPDGTCKPGYTSHWARQFRVTNMSTDYKPQVDRNEPIKPCFAMEQTRHKADPYWQNCFCPLIAILSPNDEPFLESKHIPCWSPERPLPTTTEVMPRVIYKIIKEQLLIKQRQFRLIRRMAMPTTTAVMPRRGWEIIKGQLLITPTQ